MGSAHLEPIGISLLIVALAFATQRRFAWSAAALAGSVAAKLVTAPLILLLPLRRAVLAAFAATLIILYLPFADAGSSVFGSFGTFAQTWESNGSIYTVLAGSLNGQTYRRLAMVALLATLWMLRRRGTNHIQSATIFFLVLFAISPVVHPWYLLWVLALLPLRTQPFDTVGVAGLSWSITVVCAYAAHQQQFVTGEWRIPAPMLLMEYLSVYGIFAFAAARKLAVRKRVLRFQ